MDFTISLTELEVEALKQAMADPVEWTANAIHNKARIATDEAVQAYVSYALDKGLPVPSTKLEIVRAYNELKEAENVLKDSLPPM